MEKELMQQISKMTMQAIATAMEAAGMDDKQKEIFLDAYTDYMNAMTETMLGKGKKA